MSGSYSAASRRPSSAAILLRRAQVGGPNAGGGVLGLCVDRRFDAAQLKRRFAELHRVSDLSALDRFIRTGLYRSAVPSTMGMADGRA